MQFPLMNTLWHIIIKMHLGKCLLMVTGVHGKQTIFDRVASVA